MYQYEAADLERRVEEAPKGSGFNPAATSGAAQSAADATDATDAADATPPTPAGQATPADHRGAFSRDRARVLHSAALRRLADKTQVVGPRDGDTPRTRLTHSLEVGQIARGIGSGLGLDPDLCDLAGLTHDIGHSPYGHNGERALNEVAAGGFEGNAQTLRILTRLEPKVVRQVSVAGDGNEGHKDGHGGREDGNEGHHEPFLKSFGLNLTRAALDASCKYPWTASEAAARGTGKYGAYDEDADVLEWVRRGHSDDRKSMEAQVMDWSDDVAYSVHDVEDGIITRRISLNVLWDLVELAQLAQRGAEAFGGSADELLDAADRLRALPIINAPFGGGGTFDYSLRSYATLKKMTSELVGRYVGATVAATREHNADLLAAGTLGRTQGQLCVPAQATAEVKLLKTIAVLYVMDEPAHLARQDRQRERIFRVYDYLHAGAPGSLDAMFAGWWCEANTDLERDRVIVDQIATMTESRLERLARRSAELYGFMD